MKKITLSYLNRMLSFFLVVVLCLDSRFCPAVLAAPPVLNQVPGSLASLPAAGAAQMPSLASSLGTVQKVARGSGPLLVHIQTAHGNEEAQRKIAAILKVLKEESGITTVLVEGSSQALEAERLDFEKWNPGKGQEIVDQLLKKGWLKGPELFLMQEPGAQVLGIEEQSSYLRNGRAFLHVLNEREKSGRYLSGLDTQIERLLAAYLPPDVRALLKKYEAWQSGIVSLGEWIKTLREAAVKYLGLDLSDPASQIDYPMTARLWNLLSMEKQMDAAVYENEKNGFYRLLQELPEDLRLSVRNALDQPLGQMNVQNEDPGLVFEKLAGQLPDLAALKAFPQVMLRIRSLLFQSELQADELAAETENLSQKLFRGAVRGENELRFLEIFNDYRLLKKLFSLEAVPAEVDRLLERESQMRPARLAERFKELNAGGLVKDLRFDDLPEIEGLLDAALDFYRGARERDQKMILNVEKKIKEQGLTKAALVTGGFHAHPFQEYFANKGYSYARVIPAMSGPGSRETYVRAAFDLGLKFTSPATWETPFLSDPTFARPQPKDFRLPQSRSELRSEDRAPLPEVKFRFLGGKGGLSPEEREVLFAWSKATGHFEAPFLWNRQTIGVLIAYVDGKIAGVQAYRRHQGGSLVQAEGLFVSPEFRRSGLKIATRLRRELLWKLKEYGFTAFETGVGKNKEAQGFHRAWLAELGDAAEVVFYQEEDPSLLKRIWVNLTKIQNPAGPTLEDSPSILIDHTGARLTGLDDLEDTSESRSELRAADRDGLRILAELVGLPPGTNWKEHEDEIKALQGKGLGKTHANGQILFNPVKGFPYRWPILGEHGKDWKAVITRTRVETGFFEFEVTLTKNGNAPVTRIFQVGSRKHSLAGGAKHKGEVREVLEISSELGLHVIGDMMAKPQGFDWKANSAEFLGLEGLRLGAILAHSGIVMTPARGYTLAWHLLGKVEEGWSAEIERVRPEKNFIEITVHFTHAEKPSFSRVFQIGSRTRNVEGSGGQFKGTSREFLSISPHLGIDYVAEAMTKPADFDWRTLEKEWPDLEGLALGDTNESGQLSVVPAPYYHYGWPVLGTAETGWHARLGKAAFFQNHLELSVLLTKEGFPDRRRVFQIGAPSRMLHGTLALKDREREFRDLSFKLGQHLLSSLLQDRPSENFIYRRSEVEALSGLFLGKLNHANQLSLQPYEHFGFLWQPLHREKTEGEPWSAFVMSASVRDAESFQFQVVFTRPGQEPLIRSYQAGPQKFLIHGKHTETANRQHAYRLFNLNALSEMTDHPELQKRFSSAYDNRSASFQAVEPGAGPTLSAQWDEMVEAFNSVVDKLPEHLREIAREIGSGSDDEQMIADLGAKIEDIHAVRETLAQKMAQFFFSVPSDEADTRSELRTQDQETQSLPEVSFRTYSAFEGDSRERREIQDALQRWNYKINFNAWNGRAANALIVYVNGKPAGLQAYGLMDKRRIAETQGLFVAPEYRRSALKLATRLRSELMKTLKSWGYQTLVIEVEGTDAAQGFHRTWIREMGEAVRDVEFRGRGDQRAIVSIEIDLSQVSAQSLAPSQAVMMAGAEARSELREAEPEVLFRYFDAADGLDEAEKKALVPWLETAGHFPRHLRWKQKGENALIVYVNGKPAGAQAFKFDPEDNWVVAKGLFVAPEYRRTGLNLAMKLRETLMRDFKKIGAEGFETDVAPTADSQSFHRVWLATLGDAVGEAVYEDEDPSKLMYIWVDLEKFETLHPVDPEGPPPLLARQNTSEWETRKKLTRYPDKRSELRSFEEYLHKKFEGTVPLTEAEILEYLGEEALKKSVQGEVRYYLRRLKPEDQAFIDDWEEEYTNDEVWKASHPIQDPQFEIFPGFLDLGDLSIGFMSESHGIEKLEGHAGIEIDESKKQYSMNLNQIEIHYRNRGKTGELKGVSKALMDFLLKIAADPESGITSGFSLSAVTRGGDVIADRYAMSKGSGEKRFLTQNQVLEYVDQNKLGEKFNPPPSVRSDEPDSDEGLRSLDSLLPFYLRDGITITEDEVRHYFGPAAAQKAAEEGTRYYLKQLFQWRDSGYLKAWADDYQKDLAWQAAWKEKLQEDFDPHETFPHFGRYAYFAVGLVSVKNGQEKLEGQVGLEAWPEDFDERSGRRMSYLHIAQMETYYRNRGSDGELRGVSDLLMDFLFKISTSPSSMIRHGMGLTPTTDGGDSIAQKYGMSAAEGTRRYLTQEQVLQWAAQNHVEDRFNGPRSEMRDLNIEDGNEHLGYNPAQIVFLAALAKLQEDLFPLDARAEETRDGMFLPSDVFMAADNLKQILTGGEHFIDLGSGSGTLLFLAAALGASKATGFESDPDIYRGSRRLLTKLSEDPRLLIAFNPAKVEILKKNFMGVNLAKAGDLKDPSKNVYYYFDLSSEAQIFKKDKFLAKLKKLPPGSRLVIHFRQMLTDEDLNFLELEKVIPHGPLSTYVYRVPARSELRAGTEEDSRSQVLEAPEPEDGLSKWARSPVEPFVARAHFARQFGVKAGDPVLSIGTGANPFYGIPLAMLGAHVESVTLDPRYQETEQTFVNEHLKVIHQFSGEYTVHPAQNYLNFPVPESSQKIVLFFNVLDDPQTRQQEDLVNRFLSDVDDGGYLIGSVIVPDAYLPVIQQIKDLGAARGYRLENAPIFVPMGTGGSQMPFAFRVYKQPVAGLRSELRTQTVLEASRLYYEQMRAWMLTPEDRTMTPADQARFLEVLLGRPVYSELAGFEAPKTQSLLPAAAEEVIPTALYEDQLRAAASEGGRVLFDGKWLLEWAKKNPRGLYFLLNALHQASETGGEPLGAVTGDENLAAELSRVLLQRDNGLSSEENARARTLAGEKELSGILSVLGENEVKAYAAKYQGGVAVLHSGGALFETLGANFILDPQETLNQEDEMAAAFLLPALLKAAALIRGIGEPAAQRKVLRENLQQILPGSTFAGSSITLRLGTFITQTLLAGKLIDTAA